MQNVKCKIKNGRRAPLFFPNIGDCIIAKHCSLSNSLNQEETFCVTLIRRRRRSWRHLPLRGRQARGNGSFLFKLSVFSFWYQQKEGFPHTLAFPWGKVPTSPCGGRRDELRASSGSPYPFPLGFVRAINPNLNIAESSPIFLPTKTETPQGNLR